jgi:hypothetical protein
VLKFLVKVEEDPNLKAWAADELKNFQKRIKLDFVQRWK